MHRARARVPVHAAVTASASSPLASLARATRSPTTTWHAGQVWSQARNAHETNTARQMDNALRSGANWLEGDVRRNPMTGQMVMAHELFDIGHGLALEQWLEIVRSSGRGVKIELKEPAAFRQYISAIERSGIDQSRLIVNVPVASAHGRSVMSDAQLLELRRRLPNAMINLSPTGQDRYSPAVVAELVRTSRLVGGRTMFPLEWNLASDDVIAALRPHGRVAIWATQAWGSPRHVDAEIARLRAQGVDGMIDLAKLGFVARVGAAATRALGRIVGRQALIDARVSVMSLIR